MRGEKETLRFDEIELWGEKEIKFEHTYDRLTCHTFGVTVDMYSDGHLDVQYGNQQYSMEYACRRHIKGILGVVLLENILLWCLLNGYLIDQRSVFRAYVPELHLEFSYMMKGGFLFMKHTDTDALEFWNTLGNIQETIVGALAYMEGLSLERKSK